MSSVPTSSNNRASEAWPNDEVLTEYLLGSLSTDTCQAIETWLGEDSGNGERLCELSEHLLVISQITDSFTPPVMQRDKVLRSPVAVYPVAAGMLALAATVLLVYFSLDGFTTKDSDQSQIALAWAESRSENFDVVPDWIAETGSADLNLILETDALVSSEAVETDDASETDEAFGFSSQEPPDWLLAGVQLMETAGTPFELNEAIQ